MQTAFRFYQGNQKAENQPSQATIDKMLAIQMAQLRETYHSDCLNVQQVQFSRASEKIGRQHDFLHNISFSLNKNFPT